MTIEIKKDPINQVSQPPINSPISDKSGNISRSWSVWFRDLYSRTSFKGGNAIDNNLEASEKIIEQVFINLSLIEKNAENIEKNAENIEKNADDIEKNAEDISVNIESIESIEQDVNGNVEDILNLEHRALGDSRPSNYQSSGVSYSVGAYVVYPSVDPQKYYLCQEAIADPAGPFDPSKWVEKSLQTSLSNEVFRLLTPVKAIHFAFPGASVNGAITPDYEFNVATLTRSAVGVYDGTVSQTTFYGVDIMAKANAFVSYSFTPTVTTEAFHIDFTDNGSGSFTIEIYEWVQGAGNKIDLVPYDPVTAGDLVYCTVLTDIGNGELPPA